MDAPMPDSGMGADPSMGGGAPPMDEPPMDSGNDAPMGDMPTDMGDGTQGGDAPEGYDKLSKDQKKAVDNYIDSMINDDGDNNDQNDNQMPTDDNQQQPPMPMESKRFKAQLIDEIVNGIMDNGTFDMNAREGKKGTKRDDKNIANRQVLNPRASKNRVSRPFVSGL